MTSANVGRMSTRWWVLAGSMVLCLGGLVLPALPARAAIHAVARHSASGVGSRATSLATDSPLTVANFWVTDASGHTTSYSDSSVVLNTGCLNSATFLCLKIGNSDSLALVAPSPLQGGETYSSPDVDITVGVGSVHCGYMVSTGGYDGSLELDQFGWTSTNPQPLDTFAGQVFCSDDNVTIYGTIAFNVVNTTANDGYYLYDNQGNTYGYGNDSYLTYLGGPEFLKLNQPIVSMATTPDGGGYWMTAGDGGVFAYGDAGFYGSTGNIHLNKPIVGMAATGDGGGYWFVAADGGVFAYGDAGFFGSMGGQHLNQPIVGMAATPDDGGYWLVGADGGIFAFGDAGFYGSTGNSHLNQPIVAMTPTTDGNGYWFVAADGGVFAYGDAGFYGSTGNIHLDQPITGMLSTDDDGGYLLVANDGGLFAFGDAPFYGSLGGQGATGVVGIVP